jgi:hypothetical protein
LQIKPLLGFPFSEEARQVPEKEEKNRKTIAAGQSQNIYFGVVKLFAAPIMP